MKHDPFNAGLLAFLDGSPTPFHATDNIVAAFKQAGFTVLTETAPWKLKLGGRYCVTRNDSSVIAFTLGKQPIEKTGIRMVGAHTDSPCLKLKPNPEIHAHGYQQLGVEVYGGVLLNPWFDRDLSLAGRVTLELRNGRLASRLVDFRRALATIPSLAIHLDREANDQRTINKQTYLPPVIGRVAENEFVLKQALIEQLVAHDPKLAIHAVHAFELCFYDVQVAAITGWRGEFITSARLDNLLSCYTGMRALIESSHDVAQLLICNDHEEVGSGSTSGARGNFMESVLHRIADDPETLARTMANSLLVSTDNAHGAHPNFHEKHDSKHSPLLNLGPALKTNANQSYATNSESAAVLQYLAAQAGVNLQSFVARADMGCGSTIGPLAATRLGVPTVDVGVPTFAMHSIRELAGSDDAYSLYRVLQAFYTLKSVTVA